MASISRLQTSDCDNPILDVFITQNGQKIDVSSLEFQIFENVSNPGSPVQVFPATAGAREAVDLNLCPVGQKLSTGRYVANWTVPVTELIGPHIIKWFFKVTPASNENVFSEEFEVLAEGVGAGDIGYTTIQCLRDEGVSESLYSDDFLTRRIALVTEQIEMYTGRFFTPRTLTFRVDGKDHPEILLYHPIIEISDVKIIHENPFNPNSSLVNLDNLVIYNRHLTQGLRQPDDRNNPRISFETSFHYHHFVNELYEHDFYISHFPRGKQNIEITGVFGYTDPDGTAYGKTPELIKHVANLMVIRELNSLADTGARDDAIWYRRRTTEFRTRDQSVKYSPLNAGELARNMPYTAFTGDPEIDRILLRFSRLPAFGAA